MTALAVVILTVSVLLLAIGAYLGAPGPEPVADAMTPELLAQVIGEAGGADVWGSTEKMRDAWRFLMHTALNRHLAPDVPGFLDGFFARERRPPPEAIDMARDVLGADEDPTGGCIYALSAQDLDLLGIERQGDIVLRGRGVFELHLYREWPVVRSND